MSPTAAAAAPSLPAADDYHSDDGLLSSSPVLVPIRPKLQPSPSPAPSPPSSSSSSSGGASPREKRPKRWRGPKPSQADSILLGTLDNFRHPSSSYAVDWGSEPEDAEDAKDTKDPSFRKESMSQPDASPREQRTYVDRDGDQPAKEGAKETANPHLTPMEPATLRNLAAGALAHAKVTPPAPDPGPTPPTTENDVVGEKTYSTSTTGMAVYSERGVSQQHERNGPQPIPTPCSPSDVYSPRDSGVTPLPSSKMDPRSPTASVHSPGQGEGLPPIQLNSPRGDGSGQKLPSIRAHLGDVPRLPGSHAAGSGMGAPHHGFPGSPPATIQPRLPSIHPQLSSPPARFRDPYHDPHSPGHQPAPPASGSYYYSQANGVQRPREYANASSETASSRQPGAPQTTSGHDPMSIDNVTGPTTGSYPCTFPGCTAPPFQTQYLLNSHANVHSSARPHYCPVPGCPRGKGGKGFKRKNEMIRHGLVHDSPGYVCPFCPDRDHKYPRPDNLQRHVRVHHVDKDKDDPQLRSVLAQRPNGPSRGRRRRGAPS